MVWRYDGLNFFCFTFYCVWLFFLRLFFGFDSFFSLGFYYYILIKGRKKVKESYMFVFEGYFLEEEERIIFVDILLGGV